MNYQVLDRWARGWRGPALAALVALVAGLPGLLALPPLDRDESRFAQASAQMLETGDIVSIKLQDEPRDKKPVGVYWLQAASVSLFSSPEARQIWAYRLPSLLGAMLAAAACAWGASAYFGPGRGLLAGALLGSAFLLSTEAAIAKTDAVQGGLITLAMAALGRLYGAARGEVEAGRLTRLLFWLALAGATLVKGPVAVAVAALAGVLLWGWDRDGRWLRDLGWGWGVVILLAVLGPWAAAITVKTDGAFWTSAIGGDLAPKIAGGQESHGAPPGYHLLISPLLLFPATLLLPAALVHGWQARRETGVRFALAWLVPAWLMFEILPTKLAHYTLPAHGALTWLMVAAIAAPLGERSRWAGAGLMALSALAFAAVTLTAWKIYGGGAATVAAILAAVLFLAAGAAGGLALARGPSARGLAATLALGIAAHGVLAGLVAPRLDALWLSQRVARGLRAEGLDPRNGVTPGPVAVAGYGEPSLIFLLGTQTQLVDAAGAAQAIAERRPAVVESRLSPAFQAALQARGATARAVAIIKGRNYSDGDEETLVAYEARP